MARTITIDRRYRGPLRSANGGVSAGLAAALAPAPSSVRLRRPPPLETPLTVDPEDGALHITDGETVIMDVRRRTHPVDVPVDETIVTRVLERGPVPVPPGHVAPECFVCSDRPDGLRISPRHLADTEVWATVWFPDESVSSDGRTVDDHVVWGALDCPAGFAVVGYGQRQPEYFPALTDLTAELEHPVPIGRPVVVLGWPVGHDEERANGGTAVIAEDGTILARAYAEHARLPLDFAQS